jgi:hypothetical protein
MRTTVRLWRRRQSPLWRRTDTVEAWSGLATALLIAVGAPLVGATTAWHVEDSLRQERLDRHPASAVLVTDAQSVYGETGTSTVRATVRWTASDGSVHTEAAPVASSGTAGSRTTIWLDRRGRPVDRPPTAAVAEWQGDLAGSSAALGTCIALLSGHRVVRWRLNRIRDQEWERQWTQVGPRWRHRLP